MYRRIILIAIITLLLSFDPCRANAMPAHENKAGTFIELGLEFYERMDYKKAEDYFKEALNANPSRDEKQLMLYALKILKTYKPQYKEIEYLNSQINNATQEADKKALIEKLKNAHLELARQLLIKTSYVVIVKNHFDYIISQDPVNLQAYIYLGDVNYGGMRYDDAIKNYKKALELYPDNPFFQQRLADIYVGVGAYDEARKYYTKAIEALVKSNLQDKEEKIRAIKRFVVKLPTSLDDIKTLMDEKLYTDAVTLCKKRVAINPSDVTAITYMGIALEELGRWQQAEALYKTAIKQSPDYPTPYFRLAKIFLLKRKNSQKAINEIELFRQKSEELSKIDKQAKEGIIAAQHTLVYIYNEILQDYKKAAVEGRHLLELAPEDQGAHYNLGISYIYLDKKSMAYTEFRKVIDLNPSSEIARYAKEAIESMQKYSSVRTLPYSGE